MKKRRNVYWWIVGGMFIGSVMLLLVSCLRGFCDWYTEHVYPAFADGYSRVTDLLPIPLGELLMYLGAVALIVLAVAGILLLFLKKRVRYKRFVILYSKGVLAWAVITILLYMLYWVIPFRCSVLDFAEEGKQEYTIEDLARVRAMLVEQLNKNIREAERDEEGHLVVPRDVDEKVREAMASLASEFPRLRGYYPSCKYAWCSDVIDWMGIGGYTYPYTMEVTVNKYVTPMYYPVLYAHELTHHKGFYRENEGEFISYLACARSDDAYVRYMGYASAYDRINIEYWCDLYDAYVDPETKQIPEARRSEYEKIVEKQPVVDDQYYEDQDWAWEIEEGLYEEDSHPLEQYDEVAVEASEVGWDVQADILKENIYDGVVQMLLEYYSE